jgi:hypothetical protein
MDVDNTQEDLVLQFLVQEVLQDLGRYYERFYQRNLYRESLEGVKQDVNEHVVNKFATQPETAEDEVDNIFEAVSNQLGQANGQDTIKIKAYLDVFDEWCRERLDASGNEILEAGTEDKPEAQKWLETVRDNVRSISDEQIDPELRKQFQNQLTERWNEIYDKIRQLSAS